MHYGVHKAIEEIKNSYGHDVFIKPKLLIKFGSVTTVGTSEETIMEMPGSVTSETFQTDNTIDSLVVDDTFTGDVRIEGHTISGGNLTFVVQSATCTSETPVTLTTPLARVTRVYNNSAAAMPANSTLYIYRSGDTTVTGGVPQTDSAVNIIMNAENNQSLKCSTSFSQYDYGICTRIWASVAKKTQGGAVIRVKIREIGRQFRTIQKFGVNSLGGKVMLDYDQPLIFPINSDVIMTAEADANGTEVTGSIGVFFGKIPE